MPNSLTWSKGQAIVKYWKLNIHSNQCWLSFFKSWPSDRQRTKSEMIEWIFNQINFGFVITYYIIACFNAELDRPLSTSINSFFQIAWNGSADPMIKYKVVSFFLKSNFMGCFTQTLLSRLLLLHLQRRSTRKPPLL